METYILIFLGEVMIINSNKDVGFDIKSEMIKSCVKAILNNRDFIIDPGKISDVEIIDFVKGFMPNDYIMHIRFGKDSKIRYRISYYHILGINNCKIVASIHL